MTLSLAQSAKPKTGHKEYWEWSVWLEGDNDELESVEQVDYRLHPTFPRPNRTSTSARTNFRIKSFGWGEFQIFANVRFKDGRTETLEHWLRLRTESRQAPTRDGTTKPSRVFLSYTAGDSKRAEAAKASLLQEGIEVKTAADSIGLGLPWRYALQEAINGVDAVVVIAPEHDSKAIDVDVETAKDLNRAVVEVNFYGRDSALGDFGSSTIQRIKIKEDSEIGLALSNMNFTDR